MSYRQSIDYLAPPADMERDPPVVFDAPFMPFSPFSTHPPPEQMQRRARNIFTQQAYAYPASPALLGPMDIRFPQEEIYVLRMSIRRPRTPFILPGVLGFLKPAIRATTLYQREFFPDFNKRFVYLTVRSGPVKTSQDDVFHVDGFQGTHADSVPRHLPEQNYFWASTYPTEFSMMPYDVSHVNAAYYNLNDLFGRLTNPALAICGKPKHMYVIDPYHVHRRTKVPTGLWRSFVRVSFIDGVPIKDDTCTQNPWLPTPPFFRGDIRDTLLKASDYEIETCRIG